MKKKVIIIMVNIDIDRYPLVAPYLEGYACLDSDIKKSWAFESCIQPSTLTSTQLESVMIKSNADVYAFSCYVWNMGLIRNTVYRYLEKKPEANIILGGPQVVHQGKQYLSKRFENMVICNGEGEKVFRNYLKELMNKKPDYSQIRGLSFFKNDSLVTTEDEKQINNLDEIPSPFENNLFKNNDYKTADLETGRGCPFTCKYCYWSSVLGCKPTRFSNERIQSDIERIAQKGISFLFLVDSNFGLFPQDLDTAKFIVKCKNEYGVPNKLYFSSSRNNFQRVGEIAKIFHDADIHHSCEIPLQTINETAMKRIARKQDLNSYASLVKYLNNECISSYVDLIWPLPGETLDSFKQGIAKLCEMHANTLIVYPFYFMNNIAMENHRSEYGIETIQSHDRNSEIEFVIQTNEVSYDEYLEGWRFLHTTTILYSLKSLFVTSRYLNDHAIERYGDLFCKFMNFTKKQPDMPGYNFLNSMKKEKTLGDKMYGGLVYDICHGKRKAFDLLLLDFVSSQAWWTDKNVQLYFEIDLINRGYIYSGSINHEHYTFRYIKILDTLPNGYIIEIPVSQVEQIRNMLGIKASFTTNRVEINYVKNQIAFNENASLSETIRHCYRMFYNSYLFMPDWF
jgi:radical SAM superfamily enzyme YgiQ (UPF0313 family)